MEEINGSIPKKKVTIRKTILISLMIVAIIIAINFIVSIAGLAIAVAYEGAVNGYQMKGDSDALMEIVLKYSYTLTGVYMIISLFIVLGILKLRRIKVLKEIKMEKIGLPFGYVYILFIPVAYGLSLMTNHILDLLSKYMTLPGLEQAAAISNYNNDPLFYKLLIIAIIAPLFEEFIFRGVILNELRKANKIWVAIVIQGILFGVYHMNITQGVYAMVLGFVFGYFVYYFDSIWPGVIMHMTINGISVVGAHIYDTDIEQITPVSANLFGITLGLIVFTICTIILVKVRGNNKVIRIIEG